MKLAELKPQFLRWTADTRSHHRDVSREQANGLWFLCPKCFAANRGSIGTHGIICWDPSVPLTMDPGPGRWTMSGTGFHDLTLSAQQSSVKLTSGCMWHGHVTKGEVTDV